MIENAGKPWSVPYCPLLSPIVEPQSWVAAVGESQGRDVIDGGSGDDWLVGGSGDDIVIGGPESLAGTEPDDDRVLGGAGLSAGTEIGTKVPLHMLPGSGSVLLPPAAWAPNRRR